MGTSGPEVAFSGGTGTTQDEEVTHSCRVRTTNCTCEAETRTAQRERERERADSPEGAWPGIAIRLIA